MSIWTAVSKVLRIFVADLKTVFLYKAVSLWIVAVLVNFETTTTN
jgi:hypothetical protein